MVNCFNREGIVVNKVEIIYLYLKALHASKYSNLEDAYSVIVSKYRNDDELKDIWKRLYDNNIYMDYLIPSITRISQPVEDMARHAARLLFESIERKKPLNTQTEFSPDLIIRESVKNILSDRVSLDI